MNKEDVYYGQEDDEVLEFDDLDEAIEMIIDNFHPLPVPKTITVCKFKRESVEENSSTDIDWILETWLERLDERYAGPDFQEQKPEDIEKMRKEIKSCFKKICEIYVPWTCEIISREEIETRPWIEKNAPEWIKDGIKFE